MEHVGPFTYNAARFGLGFLCLLPLLALRRPGSAASSMSPLPAGLLAGAFLFCGASLQQLGLVSTTAGKAGFITGLYVVLVPILGLFWGQRAGWGVWTGALLCVAGLFFLSVTRSLAIQRGDLLVLIGAFFWAGHVQVLGWLSPRTDPVRLACVQFAVCAVLSAAVAFASEVLSAQGIILTAGPILYGGLLSVSVAFTLQVVAQRRSHPAHAAIILSMESVFAALGGGVLLGERLGARGALGCALIFAGMIAAQLPVIMRGALERGPAQ